MLSASANRLGNLKQHADNYASLIMEELDPDHNGYIEVIRIRSRLNCNDIYLLFRMFFKFTSLENRCGSLKLY